MKKLFIVFVLLAISATIFSQDIKTDNYLNFDSLETGHSILKIDFNYLLGSNSLNNEFINTFINGGFINDELKHSVSLKNNNLLGSNNNLNLCYEFKADSLLNISNSVLRFSLSENIFADALFNDVYFNLLFFGNSNTTNADLSGFNFKSLIYQKLTIGLFKDFGGENIKLSGYAGLSIVKGQNFYSLSIPSGKLVTADNGTSIYSELNYNFNRSDSIPSNFTNWLGNGISADLYFSLKNMKNNNELSFVLNNLGGISWNENSLSTNLDTAVTFSGVELNNILDLSLFGTEFIDKDSLITELIENKTHKSKAFTYLPATLAVNYHFNSKTLHADMDLGAQTLLFSNMKIPFVYLRANTKLSKSLNGMIQFAYGGYVGFQLGVGLETKIADKLYLHIFSSNISGFLFPKSTFGQQLKLSLAYKF